MKAKLLLLMALAIAPILSPPAKADTDNLSLTIAADSSSGTYKKMLGEIISVCSDDNFSINEAKGITGGAVGNLDALVNNKAQAAFLHSDVFIAISKADVSYKRFQTLVTLYPESIHVLVLRESRMKKKGFTSFGTVEFNSLADIKDYPVGAAGGGVYTLKILKGDGGGEFNVVSYDSGSEVIKALDSGEIAAAVFVGAAPLPNLQSLPAGKYKIIPLGESIADKVKGIYRSTTISYPGLTEGPVHTLAPPAVILTRKFSTPKKLEAQRHFRECFYKHLNDLKDNGSPNWQLIEAGDKGVIDWYDIVAPQ